MDDRRFDALTKTVSAVVSRRGALTALLGAIGARFLAAPESAARRRKDRDNGGGRRKRKQKSQKTRKQQANAEAVPGKCCASGNCTPGAGKNLGKCCYEGQNLAGKNVKGANLGQANFSGAILTTANFSGANLGKTCFVDADLTGATFAGVNQSTAIFCRTQTDSGENNAGCGKGTPCCPTCDEEHPCDDGEVCCKGRCIPGECCGDGQQSTCSADQLCCDNQCQSAAWTNQTTFGSGGIGPGQFAFPRGVAVAPDGLTAWVADLFNNRIAVWTRPNNTSTAWANQTTFGGPSQFSRPSAVAVAADGLTAWVADQNHRIAVWTRPNASSTAWANQTTFGSGPGSGPSQFDIPEGVAVSADGLTAWVADRFNSRVAVWTRPNNTSTAWTNQTTFGGSLGPGPDQFDRPNGVAVSADTLTAWVTDSFNNRISVWTRSNASSTAWANQTTFGGPSQFDLPVGVAVSADTLTASVVDQGNHRISVWRLGCPAS